MAHVSTPGSPEPSSASDATRTVVWNWPNLLSGFRLGSAPVLVGLAAYGQARAYLVGFSLALFTDFLDGYLARRLNQRSEFGAKLDLWGDVASLMTLPVAFALLWPSILYGERWLVVGALVAYGCSAAVAVRKFGRLASYHTWLGKTATLVLAVGAVLAMLGWATWGLRLGLVLMTGAVLEELLISCWLKEARTDLPSGWHVWRERSRAR